MQLPFSWLKSLFSEDLNSQIIADTLTKAGIEVDLVEPYSPPFSGVIVAKVLEVSPHPDAQKLQVAKVFDGHSHYQVVCGAPNCRKDLIVAFAKPGAVLGEENPFEIKEKPVRGVDSQGMLCSADELGLGKEVQAGIIELDDSYKLGSDFKSVLNDEIFHISITPNLGHVLSVLGMAREIKAFLNIPYHLPKINPLEKNLSPFSVTVHSSECLAYHGYHLTHLKQTSTPFYMQQRLRLAGFAPKNLVVDVLNYVMFELGQPMHAFDFTKLKKEELSIHNLESSHTFTALNGKNYSLPPNTLVISSQDQIAAVAGVMGSLDTSCEEKSLSVVLESAYFSSTSIRRSIKALDLRSEAASRFEKGIDSENCLLALNRATDLICKYSGAKLSSCFSFSKTIAQKTIHLNINKTNRLLGTTLAQTEMAEILKRLEMSVSFPSAHELDVKVPSYRNDITIQEDLIEEIGRIYGLDHLKGHLSYQATVILDNPLFTFEKALKKALFSQGLQEILTCDLLSLSLAQDFKLDKSPFITPIQVLHPRSLDQCTLRLSLLSSFIPVIAKNFANKETDLQLFEVGKTHAKNQEVLCESLQAGFILTGHINPYYFDPKPRECDFFDLKGMVENFLSDVGIESVDFKTSHEPAFHPYQQLSIYHKDELIGKCGQVHPKLLASYNIDQKVFYAEFSASLLLKHQKTIYPVALAPTQPYIERDWTAMLQEMQSYEELIRVVKEHLPMHCEKVSLLDIYHQNEMKNITLRLRYRHPDKTLESSYIDQIHKKFTSDVAKKLELSL
jgi:phenylalanyl-tRNA synthetase beta chain